MGPGFNSRRLHHPLSAGQGVPAEAPPAARRWAGDGSAARESPANHSKHANPAFVKPLFGRGSSAHLAWLADTPPER